MGIPLQSAVTTRLLQGHGGIDSFVWDGRVKCPVQTPNCRCDITPYNLPDAINWWLQLLQTMLVITIILCLGMELDEKSNVP